MPNLSAGEILIILLVALIVLGPKRLPEAARSVSKGFRELRRVQTSVQDELSSTLQEVTQPFAEDAEAAASASPTSPPTVPTARQDRGSDPGRGTPGSGDTGDRGGGAGRPAPTDPAPGSGVFRPRDRTAGRFEDWGEAPLHDETP